MLNLFIIKRIKQIFSFLTFFFFLISATNISPAIAGYDPKKEVKEMEKKLLEDKKIPDPEEKLDLTRITIDDEKIPDYSKEVPVIEDSTVTESPDNYADSYKGIEDPFDVPFIPAPREKPVKKRAKKDTHYKPVFRKPAPSNEQTSIFEEYNGLQDYEVKSETTPFSDDSLSSKISNYGKFGIDVDKLRNKLDTCEKTAPDYSGIARLVLTLGAVGLGTYGIYTSHDIAKRQENLKEDYLMAAMQKRHGNFYVDRNFFGSAGGAMSTIPALAMLGIYGAGGFGLSAGLSAGYGAGYGLGGGITGGIGLRAGYGAGYGSNSGYGMGYGYGMGNYYGVRPYYQRQISNQFSSNPIHCNGNQCYYCSPLNLR